MGFDAPKMSQNAQAMEGTRPDYGARVRAARAYADLDQEQLARHLHVSISTVARIESNERALGLDEARLISERCGVPISFLLEGFALESEQPIEEVIAQLRHTLAVIEDRLPRLGRDIGVRDRVRPPDTDHPDGAGPAAVPETAA